MGASSKEVDGPTRRADRLEAQRAAKVEAILDAATEQFSKLGYARTSMATIAAAAEVSRPALYQFFDNREDVFRSVLQRILSEANRSALTALEADVPLPAKLDGFLQRRFGDISELLSAMPHGAEIIDAHLSVAPDIGQAADKEMRTGLQRFLKRNYPNGPVGKAVDLLQLGPFGMKSDRPSMTVYRKRLTTLADAAASLLRDS